MISRVTATGPCLWPLVASGLTWVVFLALAPLFEAPTLAPDLAERLAGAVRLAAIPAALVLVLLAAFRISWWTGLAPLADLARVARRVLPETVASTLVFIPLLLALATELPPSWLGCLVLLALLFSTGQLLFWLGTLTRTRLAAAGAAVTLNLTLGMGTYLILQLVS